MLSSQSLIPGSPESAPVPYRQEALMQSERRLILIIPGSVRSRRNFSEPPKIMWKKMRKRSLRLTWSASSCLSEQNLPPDQKRMHVRISVGSVWNLRRTMNRVHPPERSDRTGMYFQTRIPSMQISPQMISIQEDPSTNRSGASAMIPWKRSGSAGKKRTVL